MTLETIWQLVTEQGVYVFSKAIKSRYVYSAYGDVLSNIVLSKPTKQDRNHISNMCVCVCVCVCMYYQAGVEYKFFTEFQSHEPEFDCLKSLEIEERINRVEWCKQQSRGLFVLASNDKTIKVWRVYQKRMYDEDAFAVEPVMRGNTPDIKFTMPRGPPRLETQQMAKRTYANSHQYHIHSLSVNSDGETFLSSDDLRVNLWHLENSKDVYSMCISMDEHEQSLSSFVDTYYSVLYSLLFSPILCLLLLLLLLFYYLLCITDVIDVKPNNLEDLTEVITSATFHPQLCHILMYSTSRGNVHLCDLRDSALMDHHRFRTFKAEDDPVNKSFFSEILGCVSSARFSPDGRYVVSRDYLNMRVWDTKMERHPLAVVPVHDHMRNYHAEIYENDCMFDRFHCDFSHDGQRIISGSYSNQVMVYNVLTNSSVVIEPLADNPVNGKKSKRKSQPSSDQEKFNGLDFSRKALHVSMHPTRDAIAVAGMNKVYIYEAVRSKTTL
jgi:serine/threonine-protein phosphatase 2A regulatory subunit B